MSEIHEYEMALFTKPVKAGDIDPPGEADYQGYQRVSGIFIDGVNAGNIVFPKAEEDYPVPVTHLAAMSGNTVVDAMTIEKAIKKEEVRSRRDPNLLAKAKAVFGEDLVEDAFVSVLVFNHDTENDIKERLDAEVHQTSDLESGCLSYDTQCIRIVFCNGRVVEFDNSEWGSMELVEFDSESDTIYMQSEPESST